MTFDEQVELLRQSVAFYERESAQLMRRNAKRMSYLQWMRRRRELSQRAGQLARECEKLIAQNS